MLDKSGNEISPETREYEELLPVNSLRTRAYVKVQDGCNNFCSYCIIPYLRGRSRSRNPQSVLSEISKINPKEAVINGINLSAYDYNGIKLPGLIERLKNLPSRLRLGSLEVGVVTREFLETLKSVNNFAPHFHLSLQSGSNAVLKKMNRKYTREEYIEKVDLIREYFPDAGITTDIIVGFPTESDQDFLDTVDLVKRVNFSDIHPFPFSPRSGTKAYEMKDLSPEIKKQRLAVLLDLKQQHKKSFAEKFIGKTLSVIFEEQKDGYFEGYAENYLRVYLEKEPNEKVIKVRAVKPFKEGVLAEIL
jgi:threonylcarbamoyladenosine tRNA methylthiotransferase MtaB